MKTLKMNPRDIVTCSSPELYWLNLKAGQKRGLKEGDRVKVETARSGCLEGELLLANNGTFCLKLTEVI